MKVTHYFKDGCRIYWRAECVATMNGDLPEWDFKVFRSLEEHDDPDAHEAFHGSIPRYGEDAYVDTGAIVSKMAGYYTQVLLGMAEFLQGGYDPLIEPNVSAFADED